MCKCDALGHHRSLFARCEFLEGVDICRTASAVGTELLPLLTRIQILAVRRIASPQRHAVDLRVVLTGIQDVSYLNDKATRVRNAVTFPFSTFISIFTTSATRKSRIEVAAVSTACRPASSQEVALSPTTSTIR